MRKKDFKHVHCALCLFFILGYSNVFVQETNKTEDDPIFQHQKLVAIIQTLQREIESSQWKRLNKVSNFVNILLARKQYPGLYPSHIQLRDFFLERFVDKPIPQKLHPLFELRDNNMFTTALITDCLLEAETLGAISVDPDNIRRTISAILLHRDRNLAPGVPGFCFYRQIRNKQGEWFQCPVNIYMVTHYLSRQIPKVYKIGKLFGVDLLSMRVSPSPDMQEFITKGDLTGFINRFNMPADADDTGLALSLGMSITHGSTKFPIASELWNKMIYDYDAIMQTLVSYAYHPFSPDSSKNLIDPRTYHWLKPYLQKQDKKTSVFFTTWMQSCYEGKQFGNRTTKIPMNMNNIDPTVSADLLLGLHKTLIHHPRARRSFDKTGMKNIYIETVKLLSWIVTEGLAETHPDILLLYYPTVYQFYWSLSRNLFFLNNTDSDESSTMPILSQSRALLANALYREGTDFLISKGIWNSGRTQVYWEGEFHQCDDRIYATSLALNALMDIWTRRPSDLQAGLRWIESTPSEVKKAIKHGFTWLYQAVAIDHIPFDNICFSGSVKGYNTLPFFFPLNVTEQYGDLIIHGFRGVIPNGEYNHMLEEKQSRVPFGRLGQRSDHFMYWTSPIFTKAVALLVFSKYLSLING